MLAEALEKATEERAGLIASRTGDVLGPHTILKEDHFPGCQSAKLPNIIPGAPNFRGVPGQNVYGSALPTVEGIKAVLTHVGAGASTHNRRQVSSTSGFWLCMIDICSSEKGPLRNRVSYETPAHTVLLTWLELQGGNGELKQGMSVAWVRVLATGPPPLLTVVSARSSMVLH